LFNSVLGNISKSNILIKRILAFIIDMFAIGFLGAVISIIIELIYGETYLLDFIFYAVIILLFLKDISYKDGSFGKVRLGLKIVSVPDKEKVSIVNKIVRNITLFIWPIELIVLLIKNRKLMDSLLSLEVIDTSR